MKVVFKGEPNLLVKNSKGKPLFRFDENGLFRTDRKKLIEKLKARFEIISDIYDEMTIDALRKYAKKYKIKNYTKYSKQQLAKLIREIENE